MVKCDMSENNAYCGYFSPFSGFCQEKLYKLTKNILETGKVNHVYSKHECNKIYYE
jgi:hypothetical protein